MLFRSLDSAGDVYLDDVSLVRGDAADPGPNLVDNGGFESALSGPWVSGPGTDSSAITTASAHSGQGSLHLVFDAAGSQTIAFYQDTAPVVTNSSYTLSFWYLPGSRGSNLTARLGSAFRPSVSVRPNAGLATPGSNNTFTAWLPPYPSIWLNELQPNQDGGLVGNTGIREPWKELFPQE